MFLVTVLVVGTTSGEAVLALDLTGTTIGELETTTVQADEVLGETVELVESVQSAQTDEASSGDDEETSDIEDNLASPLASIKIAKVQIGCLLNEVIWPSCEFVTIYNSSAEPVGLNGFSLEFLSASHSGDSSPTRMLKKFQTDILIDPFGYYAVAYSDHLELLEADDVFDVNYNPSSGSLAASGGAVRLVYGGQVGDLVGWGSAKQREEKAISSSLVEKGGALTRCVYRSTGMAADTDNNSVDFTEGDPVNPYQIVYCPEYEEEPEQELLLNTCMGLILSEVGANLASEEQFIEVHNATDQVLDITDCQLKTNRSSKTYMFSNLELARSEYLAVLIPSTDLTLTKTTTGTVFLLDAYGSTIDEVSYSNLKSGTTLALFTDGWKSTYVATPDDENQYEEFLPCSLGYERNPDTGRCRKIVEEEPLPDCGEGKFRNPETGRCKSYATLASIQAPCADGYYRNPDTGRCKKIAVATDPVPCQDGYERNPDTGRCRKIRENNGADYGVETLATAEESAFTAWVALGSVVGVGLAYIGFQFRHEIAGLIKKIFHPVISRS